MKTMIKAMFVTLIIILGVSVKSKAQTYYPVYLCESGTAKLHIPEEKNLTNGDKVYWYLNGTQVAENIYDGTDNSTDYVTPNNLAHGVNRYTSKILSVANCWGEESAPFEVYQLPSKTLALTTSSASYCGDDASLSSVITATTTPLHSLPDGIEYEYVWTATKNGTAVSPLSGIGTDAGLKTAVNTFTLTTTGAGTYVFNATVKYVKATGNTGVLKSGDNLGCETAATATQTVIVTPKPAKPTIVIQ